MTIKQIGGVFGRHPSFQDVETQDFTATGNVNLSGASPIAMGAVTGLLNVFRDSSAANIFEVERTGTGAGKTGMRQDGGLFTVDTNNDGIRWMRGGSEMARLRFDNLSVGTTSITHRLNIAGNIGLTGNVVVASGQGIDFSATAGTGTSELFDDYEEGTWTVELYDAASAGNVSPTTATGYYTKIGRQVSITFSLANIDTTGMTAGNQIFFTLPFTAGFVANGTTTLELFALAGARTWVSSWVNASETRGRLRQSGNAETAASLTVAAITSGTSDIERCSLTYFVG